MSITYVTIALTGKHSLQGINKLLTPMMMAARQAFGVINTHTHQPVRTTKELPHAFTEFNTATASANDHRWDARALGHKKDTRLTLDQIRTLQLVPDITDPETNIEPLHS